jgi:hypothetical protein
LGCFNYDACNHDLNELHCQNNVCTLTKNTSLKIETYAKNLSDFDPYNYKATYDKNPSYNEKLIILLSDGSGYNYSINQSEEYNYQIFLNRKEVNKKFEDELVAKLKPKGLSYFDVSSDGTWIAATINREIYYDLLSDPLVEGIRPISSDSKLRYDLQLSWNYLKNCTNKEDCIYVQKSCCWGDPESINKKYQDYYNAKREIECKGALCLLGIPKYEINTDCVNNTCTVTKFETGFTSETMPTPTTITTLPVEIQTTTSTTSTSTTLRSIKVDSKLFEAYANLSDDYFPEFRVMIAFRDVNTVQYSENDSKETRLEKFRLRSDENYKFQNEKVQTYGKDEFNLKVQLGSENAISGYLTKKGFERLLKDTDVIEMRKEIPSSAIV